MRKTSSSSAQRATACAVEQLERRRLLYAGDLDTSFGVGGMIGLTRNLALRLDWDRWRFKMPAGGGDRENIDTLTLGAQFTFGGPR